MPLDFTHKLSLIVYLTCGDPSLRVSREIVLNAIDAGADIIELGVPFSDPVADGPTIQRASQRALRNGTTLQHVLELASDVRRARPHAGLIVFTYLNPVLRFGLERFARAAKSVGVDGALITDLTVEEAADYVASMREHELATVFLAAPTSSDQRLKKIAATSRGFVYAVSRTGVTGKQQQLAGDAQSLVRRLRRFTQLPIAVGFGISTAEQFHQAGKFADAVVVGSAVVELIENNPAAASHAVGQWVRDLKR